MARRRRNPEVIAGRVNADGSIAAGDGFTATGTGAGAYTLAFAAGFRLVAISLTSGNVAASVARTVTTTDQGVTLFTFASNTGTAGDAPFGFVAVGVQQ